MVTGRPLALLLPAFVVLTNVTTMPRHIESGKKHYGKDFEEYASRTPAIVPGLWPAMSTKAAKAN